MDNAGYYATKRAAGQRRTASYVILHALTQFADWLSAELIACPWPGAFRPDFRGCNLRTNAVCARRGVFARRNCRRRRCPSAFSCMREKWPRC